MKKEEKRSREEIIRLIRETYGKRHGAEQTGKVFRVTFRPVLGGSKMWRVELITWGPYSSRTDDYLFLFFSEEEVAQFRPTEYVADLATTEEAVEQRERWIPVWGDVLCLETNTAAER